MKIKLLTFAADATLRATVDEVFGLVSFLVSNVMFPSSVLIEATIYVLDLSGLAYQAMVLALRIRLCFALALVLVIIIVSKVENLVVR